jgi:hypothetical protein
MIPVECTTETRTLLLETPVHTEHNAATPKLPAAAAHHVKASEFTHPQQTDASLNKDGSGRHYLHGYRKHNSRMTTTKTQFWYYVQVQCIIHPTYLICLYGGMK